MEKERLFSEFPPVETEAWKNRIIEDLKGADYDKKMVWKTNEGFEVKPFYRKEDVPQRCSGEVPENSPSRVATERRTVGSYARKFRKVMP